jgi:hypothetical protein
MAYHRRPVERLRPATPARTGITGLTRLRQRARAGQGFILWTSGWSCAWAVWTLLHLAGLA